MTMGNWAFIMYFTQDGVNWWTWILHFAIVSSHSRRHSLRCFAHVAVHKVRPHSNRGRHAQLAVNSATAIGSEQTYANAYAAYFQQLTLPCACYFVSGWCVAKLVAQAAALVLTLAEIPGAPVQRASAQDATILGGMLLINLALAVIFMNYERVKAVYDERHALSGAVLDAEYDEGSLLMILACPIC
eukprot:1160568-Pelagomonas_calceolata.AAC.9